MFVEYAVVWVHPDTPETIDDIYGDNISSLAKAQQYLSEAASLDEKDKGGSIPRIVLQTTVFL